MRFIVVALALCACAHQQQVKKPVVVWDHAPRLILTKDGKPTEQIIAGYREDGMMVWGREAYVAPKPAEQPKPAPKKKRRAKRS